MNRVNFCKLIVLSLVLSIAFLGCRKSPKSLTLIPGKVAGGPTTGPKPIGPATPETGPKIPAGDQSGATRLQTTESGLPLGERWDPKNFNEDRDTFRQQTVYFDFDKSTVKESERGKVQAVAAFLKNEARTMLQIEGHCDERGTAEYNRSLGERRALGVREYLATLGIAGERINTVSFGEDRPADPGHDEAAWAKNRRAEFILLRPKQ